jgi:hypothetical protein
VNIKTGNRTPNMEQPTIRELCGHNGRICRYLGHPRTANRCPRALLRLAPEKFSAQGCTFCAVAAQLSETALRRDLAHSLRVYPDRLCRNLSFTCRTQEERRYELRLTNRRQYWRVSSTEHREIHSRGPSLVQSRCSPRWTPRCGRCIKSNPQHRHSCDGWRQRKLHIPKHSRQLKTCKYIWVNSSRSNRNSC